MKIYYDCNQSIGDCERSDACEHVCAKFMGLTFPCNLSSISRPRFSGGGEAWGCSPHSFRAGPRRHRGGYLGAQSQGKRREGLRGTLSASSRHWWSRG